MQYKHTNKGRVPLLLPALFAATVLTVPVGSMAQDNTIEEIVITGSRIARDPESYLGGMSIVSGEEIERVGSYSTNDMLLRMPAIGSQGTQRNNANGGRGANFTEIHQLQAERTLVLMNGRRMVSTIRDNVGLAVDLQNFPVNMIDRIEVLADGASAVYGSDAVAGVVNIITKTDFEGVELSGGYGSPNDGGGDSANVGLLFGIQGSKGHFVAGATLVDTDNVDQQQRSWSRIPLLGQLDAGGGTILNLIGSGIPPQGRAPNDGIIFIPDAGTGLSYQFYDTFGFAGLNGSATDGSIQAILDEGHRFNYNDPGGEGSSLIAPARVWNGAVTGEYNMDNGMTAYMELMAQHREGTLFFTPLPVADAHGRFTDLIQVPFTNPNIPADALAFLQGNNPGATGFQMWWRGLDLGNRKFEYDNDTMKGTFGLQGELNFADRDWHWDTFMTWGRSLLSEITSGQINVSHLQIAVDPVQCALHSACPGGATPTLNIFGRSPKTQAEKDFILFDDHDKTEYEMWHLGLSFGTDELFTMPAGGVGFAAGVEWRNESGASTPSAIVQAGDSGGNFAEPTEGDYTVWETYAEVSIPLLQGEQWAEELTLEGAVRHSDYGTRIGSETTWKFGGRWTPHHMVSFRGQVSTGFRAPNILELYGGKVDNFIGVTDPCNAALVATNAVAAANCAAQGVPVGYTQPAFQLKVSQGGNPDLTPEKSDHYSVGVVLTPDQFIDDLTVAIDYYNVDITDAVDTPTPDAVIEDCYNTPGLASPNCARISRGPSGSVTRFDLLLENLAGIKTDGVDINARYSLDTEFGLLQFGLLANWLHKYNKIAADGTVDERVDNVACDVCDFVAYPRWRTTFDAILSRNNWSAGVTWRMIDDMDLDDQIGFDTENPTVPRVHYVDLFASYNWRGHRFMIGVDNVGDREPPFVPSISNNTSPIYDFLGRFVYARANLTF